MSRQAVVEHQVVDVSVLRKFWFLRLVKYQRDYSEGGVVYLTRTEAKWIPVWRIVR